MRRRWLAACVSIGAICGAAPAHGAGPLPIREPAPSAEELRGLTSLVDPALDFANVFRGAPAPAPDVPPALLHEIAARASSLRADDDSAAEFRASWDLAVNLQILASHSMDPAAAAFGLYEPTTALVDSGAHADPGSARGGAPAAPDAAVGSAVEDRGPAPGYAPVPEPGGLAVAVLVAGLVSLARGARTRR
jgi:hypothetical protein